ncbi:hypothetical protein OUS11_001986, partial [Enterococcus hirae]|nr:hypothetical protein [Enterococcus hirae]
MDSFKTKVGFSKVYRITPANYEKQTKKRRPYVLEREGMDSYYAVCPECDNPIQIIGLYKETRESGRKPYGKHHKGTIPYLAKYSEEDYLECPFSNSKWKKTSGRRSTSSPLANRILLTLEEQFDRIIYILKKQTGLLINKKLAKEMLITYLKNEGWLYKEATLNNLPWIFGQCSPAIPLFGRMIQKNSELHQVIQENCPEVQFVPASFSSDYVQIKNQEGMFVTLYFTFLNHEKCVVEEEIHETMDFLVFRENRL